MEVNVNEGGVTHTRGGKQWFILPAGCMLPSHFHTYFTNYHIQYSRYYRGLDLTGSLAPLTTRQSYQSLSIIDRDNFVSRWQC
jgi:hypothetical protein